MLAVNRVEKDSGINLLLLSLSISGCLPAYFLELPELASALHIHAGIAIRKTSTGYRAPYFFVKGCNIFLNWLAINFEKAPIKLKKNNSRLPRQCKFLFLFRGIFSSFNDNPCLELFSKVITHHMQFITFSLLVQNNIWQY